MPTERRAARSRRRRRQASRSGDAVQTARSTPPPRDPRSPRRSSRQTTFQAPCPAGHQAWRRRRRRWTRGARATGRHGVAAAGFSAILALAIAQIIASLWDRPRPYEAHSGDAHLLLAPSPDPSFPSDHATGAYAIAFAILLRHRNGGVVALLLATLVAVARVALGTHYPSDVLGGAALGALAALTLWAPAIRTPLHRLADWAGEHYERLADALGRRAARTFIRE